MPRNLSSGHHLNSPTLYWFCLKGVVTPGLRPHEPGDQDASLKAATGTFNNIFSPFLSLISPRISQEAHNDLNANSSSPSSLKVSVRPGNCLCKKKRLY